MTTETTTSQINGYDGPPLNRPDSAELVEKLANVLGGGHTTAQLIVLASAMNIPVATATGNIIIDGDSRIIRGKLALALAARAGYGVVVIRSDRTVCQLGLRRTGDETGRIIAIATWRITDAITAGLVDNQIWATYADDSLYWRAVGRLIRRNIPHVLEGITLLSEELTNTPAVEMSQINSAYVDKDGRIIPSDDVTTLIDNIIVVGDDGLPTMKSGLTRDELANVWCAARAAGALDAVAGTYNGIVMSTRDVITTAARAFANDADDDSEPDDAETPDTTDDDAAGADADSPETDDAETPDADPATRCGCDVDQLITTGTHADNCKLFQPAGAGAAL